jgi:hypothetical protein
MDLKCSAIFNTNGYRCPSTEIDEAHSIRYVLYGYTPEESAYTCISLEPNNTQREITLCTYVAMLLVGHGLFVMTTGYHEIYLRITKSWKSLKSSESHPSTQHKCILSTAFFNCLSFNAINSS